MVSFVTYLFIYLIYFATWSPESAKIAQCIRYSLCKCGSDSKLLEAKRKAGCGCVCYNPSAVRSRDSRVVGAQGNKAEGDRAGCLAPSSGFCVYAWVPMEASGLGSLLELEFRWL